MARTRVRLAALALALAGACGLMPPEEGEGGAGAPPTESPPPAQALPPAGYRLVFEDDFQGTALGPAWNALSEPRRDALSTPQAVAVSGGVLTVTTFTGTDGVHRTGFLTTEGNVEARRGYFEARIRFNTSPGSWCAFWLATATIGDPLGDPATAGVESDVVEHRVTDPG
jgi:beta-glucanase (GH16 family)